MSYTQAFTGCWSHQERGFNHNCLACLIHTVGKLCEMLDDKERQQNTPQVIHGPVGPTIYELGSYTIESKVSLSQVELNNIVLTYEKYGQPYIEQIQGVPVWRVRRLTDPRWEEPLV